MTVLNIKMNLLKVKMPAEKNLLSLVNNFIMRSHALHDVTRTSDVNYEEFLGPVMQFLDKFLVIYTCVPCRFINSLNEEHFLKQPNNRLSRVSQSEIFTAVICTGKESKNTIFPKRTGAQIAKLRNEKLTSKLAYRLILLQSIVPKRGLGRREAWEGAEASLWEREDWGGVVENIVALSPQTLPSFFSSPECSLWATSHPLGP